MKTYDQTKEALDSIREKLDIDVVGADIDSVQNKLLNLNQLMGLSAEANATAKKLLGQKELEVMLSLDKNMAPSKAAKMLNATCNEQQYLLEYADRLNASLVHVCNGLIQTISLYKVEMQNSLKQ